MKSHFFCKGSLMLQFIRGIIILKVMILKENTFILLEILKIRRLF